MTGYFRRPGSLISKRTDPPNLDGTLTSTQYLSAANIRLNAGLGVLPANGFLLYLLLRETSGHTVSVGIGTTLGNTDVLSAQLVPASGTVTVSITSFSVGWFSATLTQALFLTSASWNSASINASLIYQAGP